MSKNTLAKKQALDQAEEYILQARDALVDAVNLLASVGIKTLPKRLEGTIKRLEGLVQE